MRQPQCKPGQRSLANLDIATTDLRTMPARFCSKLYLESVCFLFRWRLIVHHLLAFEIDNHQFGLNVPLVERVVPACEITPIPDCPPAVLGLISVQGVITPVLNTRRKLGLPERPLAVSDYFVIASAGKYHLALPVDLVTGLLEYDDNQLMQLQNLSAKDSQVDVLRIVDGLILVYDPNKSLDEVEKKQLAIALERARKPHESGS